MAEKKAAKKAKKAKAAKKADDPKVEDDTKTVSDGYSMEVEVLDDDGKPTGETRVVEAVPQALKAYARLHKVNVKGITDVPGLVSKVLGSIKIKKGEDSYECVTCNTSLPASGEDTFCPYCGGDMTEDDTGGLEKWLDENKQVKVIDNSDKPPNEPEPASKPASEIATIDPEADADTRTLDERRENIVNIMVQLDSHSGEAAYDLGQELYRIEQTELYDEAGFDTFRSFCDAPRDKGGLGMSFANAKNYIRIFSSPSITRELAAAVGYTKAFTMANLLDDPRTAKPAAKLIEPDKEGEIPITAMPTKAVKDHAKNIRADARTKTPAGKGSAGGKRGRPARSKFAPLMDLSLRTKIVELNPDGDGTLFECDEKIAIEAVLTQGKDNKFRLKLFGVELSDE